MFQRSLWALWVLGVSAGCATWTDEVRSLPVARMSPETVVLEICSVRPDLIAGAEELDVDIWREADEQYLPAELQRRLAVNGIRLGILGPQIPQVLRNWLDQGAQGEFRGDLTEPVPIESETAPTMRRLQSRSGQGNKIVASETHRQLVVLVRDEQLMGESFTNAQCLWTVTTYPQSDGRVRVQLTPEIQHGQPRQHIAGEHGAFFFDYGRPQRVFEFLRTQSILSPGETLVVSSTPDAKGLGKQFLTESRANGYVEREVLLIRLAQTQFDDDIVPDTATTGE